MTDEIMTDEMTMTPEAASEPDPMTDDTSTIAPPPASREADGSDAPPAPTISGKGPMDQSVPDVATGSTPVTRRDD